MLAGLCCRFIRGMGNSKYYSDLMIRILQFIAKLETAIASNGGCCFTNFVFQQLRNSMFRALCPPLSLDLIVHNVDEIT